MGTITKWLVLRVSAPAKSGTGILSNCLPSRGNNPNPASDMKWAIGPRLDRGFVCLRLLRSPVEPLKVQGTGRTGHDHCRDLVRGCGIYQNPGAILRLEDLRETAEAVPCVIA